MTATRTHARHGRPGRLRRLWRERLRAPWRIAEWPIVLGLAALAFVLGYLGFARHFELIAETRSRFDYTYLSLQLFTLESGSIVPPIPGALQVARFLAPAAAIYTAVRALLAVFRDQLQQFRSRWLLRHHVIVCGLGERGLQYVAQFLDRDHPVVVVERDPANPMLESCREWGAYAVVGDATDEDVLRRCGVAGASHLVAVLPDDAANAEVATRARRCVEGRGGEALTVHVHVEDLELCDLLRDRVAGDVPRCAADRETEGAGRTGRRSRGSTTRFRLSFFNVLETGAQMMMDQVPFGGGGTAAAPRLVVVGLGKMGRSLVAQAGREWPFWRAGSDDRLALTLIDAGAEEKVEILRLRYPFLDETCRLEVLQLAKNSAEFERAGFLQGEDGGGRAAAVFLCFDDDVHVLAAALALNRRTQGRGLPIVMRMTEEGGLAALLDDARAQAQLANLRAVPLLEWTCDPDLLLYGETEPLARALHEGGIRRQPVDAKGSEPREWRRLAPGYRQAMRDRAAGVGERLARADCSRRRAAGPISPFAFTEDELTAVAAPLADRDSPGGESLDSDFVRALPAALARTGWEIARGGAAAAGGGPAPTDDTTAEEASR